jgi:NADH:ubiquinone oxidoreductase subunit 2 (subunit N)
LIVALVSGGLGLWLWQVNLTEPIRTLPLSTRTIDLSAPLERWGFAFQLQSAAIPILVVSCLVTASAAILAMHMQQGLGFASLALGLLLGYLLLALLATGPLPPPLLTPLFLVMLSALSIFMLQAGRLNQNTGPLRTVLPPLLAFPLFLLAFWYIDQIPLNPQDNAAQQVAGQLLSLGFLLLLAPVPLHSAQPVTAQSAPPVVTAFVTLLYQFAVVHLFFRLYHAYPFLTEATHFTDWLTWAGLATAVWGGLAAAGATHPGRLWGYAALHDWGIILLVLAVPSPRSWTLALFLLGLRAVSMFTAGVGLALLEERSEQFTAEQLQGIGNRLPWNCAAFLLGGLGLLGFPLSAGFTGHWAALQAIAESDWRPAAVVLLASGGAIYGFIRLARLLFGSLYNRYLPREGAASAVLAILVLLLSVSLAVAPQLLANPVTRTLAALSS